MVFANTVTQFILCDQLSLNCSWIILWNCFAFKAFILQSGQKGVYFLFLFIAFIFKVRMVVGEQGRRVCFFDKSEKEDCFFLTFCFIPPLSIKFDKLMFTSLYILKVLPRIQFGFKSWPKDLRSGWGVDRDAGKLTLSAN